MNNQYFKRLLDLWKARALKAETRVRYLEKLLKENNVSYEPSS